MDVTVSEEFNLASNIDGIAHLLLVLEECEPAIRQTIAEPGLIRTTMFGMKPVAPSPAHSSSSVLVA